MSSKVNESCTATFNPNMDLMSYVNTNDSLLGHEIKAWIESTANNANEAVSADARRMADTLYYKYVAPRSGQTSAAERHLQDDAYYFIRRKSADPDANDASYIIRDLLKSPRKIPQHMMELDLVKSNESYKGSLIAEWAYAQHASAENPFFLDGLDIISKYLQSSHPINRECHYFVTRTKRGVMLTRDTEKSPRASSESKVNQNV